MKLLYISGSYPPIKCGVGDYVFKLTHALFGIDWRIITSYSARGDKKIKNIIDSWAFNEYRKIRREIEDFKPDILHIQYPSVCYGKKPFINFLPYKLRKDYPNIIKVITIHEYHDASKLGKKRVLATIKPFDHIIVSNIQDLHFLKNKMPQKNYHLARIGSNIDFIKFSQKDLNAYINKYNPKNKKIILNLGFVDSSKGVEKLVNSTKDWLTDTKLIIATDFDKNNKYHQKLSKIIKNIGTDILWTGYLDAREISALMQISYATALPFDAPISLRRGSLVAAIIHDLPIITTGPAEELLVDKKNCLLLVNNSPDQITKKINILLTNEKLYKLIKVNLSKVSKEFEWREIAKKNRQIYQKLISKDQS